MSFASVEVSTKHFWPGSLEKVIRQRRLSKGRAEQGATLAVEQPTTSFDLVYSSQLATENGSS